LTFRHDKVAGKRLDDFATTDVDKAALSHWIHNRGTKAAETYAPKAKSLLPEAIYDLFKKDSAQVHDVAGRQMLFDDVLGVPFPPPRKPGFTFIDLFAGIGGFRIAMQSCGGKCVFSSEWDKAARKTYFDNYGEIPFGDITLEETKRFIPTTFDVLCAGFPCQPFSLAGVSARTAMNKDHGFKDKTQGTLFFDIMQIVRSRKPKVLFLENVKNIVNHDKGNTFRIIQESIEKEGYSFHYEIIDSSSVVPQKRVRCYMVCIKDGGSFAFPSFEGPALPLSSILEKNPDDSYTISDGLWAGHMRRTARNLDRGTGFTAFTADLSKPSRTLVARYYKDGKECLVPQEGKNPRMLTPRECARLQGFPGDFILASSRTVLYKQMGNSVVVPVLSKIALEIKRQSLSEEG
jgi:DNA (cytosine-5)-methyltransferase 1